MISICNRNRPHSKHTSKYTFQDLLPLDRLQPVLELRVPLRRDLESGACRHYNAGKLLIVALGQMIQLLMDALDVPATMEKVHIILISFFVQHHDEYSHLLTLLDERRERRTQVLHHHLVVVPAQIVGGLNGHVMQHERTHDRVDRTDAELVQILGAQFLADP